MIITTLLPRLIHRNGKRLMLAFGSLLVGALTLAVVLGLIGSVERFFVSESRTLLGGDVTIEDDVAIDLSHPLLLRLSDEGALLSPRIETMVVARKEGAVKENAIANLLVSLKVVDNNYPLFGSMGLTRAEVRTPSPTEIFVAEDLLVRMGVTIGETLYLGNTPFLITNVITSEPDRVGGSFRLGPLAVLSHEGFLRTGLLGKQSRVDHILAVRYPATFTGSDAVNATAEISESFPRPKYRVAIAKDGPSSLLRVLDSAERFFFTMIVLALFLVIVNIRLNLVYFLSSFQKTIAIMRSLGMRKSQLLALFLSLLLFGAVCAGVLGVLMGNIIANTALPFASEYIESALPVIPILDNVIRVTVFVFLLCLFATLEFFVRLLSIEPRMLLHGYDSLRGRFSLPLKELSLLFLTLLSFYAGVYYLTERALVALTAVGGITGVFAVLFLLSRGAIVLGHQARFALPFSIRSILNFLKHQGILGTTAIASLTIALASVFAIALLEKNMLNNLSVEFKEDAPNIYLVDVQEDQLSGVREIMGSTWKDFGRVPARFTKRDGYDIQANLATEDSEMRREFNVTSGSALIDGERLISGTWHGPTGRGDVSVEEDFAKRAKLSIGSRVEFTVQGFPVEATVTSIRAVTTTGGLPFFFLVFSPDVLLGIPRTSFGYAYAPAEEIPKLQNELARRYPNITSIPTTEIIKAATKIVGALSVAVVATAFPALVLGLILIIAMLAISARERTNDMLVFTAYGARTKLLFLIFLIESSAIVVLAGIFATLLSHVGVYALNYYVFDFTGFYFAINNVYLFGVILTATLFIAYLFARRFGNISPAELLRKEGL